MRAVAPRQFCGLALLVLLLLLPLARVHGVGETPGDGFQEALSLMRAGDSAGARSRMLELARAHDARAQDVLAAMVLKGVGGPASVPQAMGWYCMLAHHPDGGRATVNALWFLAEYFRTGGGVPGHDYTRGEPGRENPLKAMFWFRLLQRQRHYYQKVLPEGVRLGRMGAGIVQRQLLPGERAKVEERLLRWSSSHIPQSAASCLALP